MSRRRCTRCRKPLSPTVALVSDACPGCVGELQPLEPEAPVRLVHVALGADERPTDLELLERVRALVESKHWRAAMLHYTAARNAHGKDAAATRDAEINAIKKTLELAVAMLGAGIVP